MMEKTRKAPAGAGTPTRAAGKDLAIGFPKSNFITTIGSRQIKVSDVLSYGQANAIPLRHLCTLTGLDGRTVRARIADERRTGTAILSDNSSGYYLSASEEEKARFVQSMRHRAKEILYAADAVEKGK